MNKLSDDFFRKPKVLKDYEFYRDENFILLEKSEGMSFSPIRMNGCLHWVALAIVFLTVGTFVVWVKDVVLYWAEQVLRFLGL